MFESDIWVLSHVFWPKLLWRTECIIHYYQACCCWTNPAGINLKDQKDGRVRVKKRQGQNAKIKRKEKQREGTEGREGKGEEEREGKRERDWRGRDFCWSFSLMTDIQNDIILFLQDYFVKIIRILCLCSLKHFITVPQKKDLDTLLFHFLPSQNVVLLKYFYYSRT